jgi:hypothetical protein
MWTHEPGSRLSSTLFERFAGRLATEEFPRLSHERLMEESQRRLADAMASGQPGEERLVTRLVENPRDYRRWEDEHAMLMRRISAERLPGVQKAQLLSTSLSLIHRKAMFEYLRDEQVRGRRREQIVAQFSSQRDYVSAIVAEHGRYVRSAASYLCSSHVGSNVMFDTLFETPLAEYEELYASYFRTYCNSMFAADDNALAKSMLPVLVDLKKQLSEWRRALVALTHSQSGVWRRPTL